MISKIPTIIVTMKDKKYKLTREDFSFVRQLVLGARDISHTETAERVRVLLASSLKFKNKKVFTLTLEPLAVDTARFTIASSHSELSAWDIHYMSNLIKCAALQPDTVVILPSYITIDSPSLSTKLLKGPEAPPEKPKAKRTRKPKKTDKSE
jgi:hypothetical protein